MSFRFKQGESHSTRRTALIGFGSAAVLTGLGGCSGIDVGGGSFGGSGGGGAGVQPSQPQNAPGSTIGTGAVRIALILPLSASGNAANIASNLRNACELAISEFSGADITVLIKDDLGSGEGAQNAARAALSEGAELILGPLFAPSVQAVGAAARPAGKPVIAFSTDTSVASRGVYLLSFLPQNDVQRIVQYAVQNGKRSFASFTPDTAYGQVAQGAFQEAVAANGGRVVALEKFASTPTGPSEAARRLTSAAGTIDAVFVPDPFDGAAPTALKNAGIDINRIQILGTGPWDGNQGAALAAPSALYATADSAGFRAFATRYRAKFGQEPARIASLGYDATMLVAALARTQGSARFAEGVLTNASGFNGVDGLFRFRPDGTNQRGLAVLRANGTVVSAAPKTFAAS